MKHTIPILTCIYAMSLPLTGCSDLSFLRKCPMCGNKDSEVYVAFDWRNAPDADPEGMSVLFYPLDNNPFWRFELPLDGGEVTIPSETYNVVAYNNDTSSILFENQDDYASSIVTSREAKISDALSKNWAYTDPPRNAEDANQPVMSQPDHIWASRHTLFNASAQSKSLLLTPDRITSVYSISIKNVTNAESAYQCGAAVSGLSAGRRLSSMQLVDYNVTVPGTLTHASSNSFSGTLRCFGRINGKGACRLTLYFFLRDGEKKAFEYDVTSIVENAPDPYNVTIEVDGVDLPDISTSSPDSGLDVGLDEWDVVDIDLSN